MREHLILPLESILVLEYPTCRVRYGTTYGPYGGADKGIELFSEIIIKETQYAFIIIVYNYVITTNQNIPKKFETILTLFSNHQIACSRPSDSCVLNFSLEQR